MPTSSDARGATTVEKKGEVSKDYQKWVKQTFFQHLLAGADDLVVIGNHIPFFILIEVFDNSRVKYGSNTVDIHFFNLVLSDNKYHDLSKVTWSSRYCLPTSSDARGATTVEKKIEVTKDCKKWVKQMFLQHLLARADDLVVIGN